MTDKERVIKGLESLHERLLDAAKQDAIATLDASMVADALAMLKEQKEEWKAEQSDWISVKERMPVELHSIFYPWYGKKQWSNAMWREQSDKVLVTVEFKDGTRIVTTGETHDGVWHTAISRTLDPIVTHWMQFPELPEGVKWDADGTTTIPG